jgi:hypothetical protein
MWQYTCKMWRYTCKIGDNIHVAYGLIYAIYIQHTGQHINNYAYIVWHNMKEVYV